MRQEGRRIDGHAPFLSGKDLNAYLVAGIRSDHETTTQKEAKEKLKNGMWIMAREGTTARNLKDLLPLVTPENSRRFLFVTDDRHPKELLEEGHIDSMVRKAIQWGIDPILAIQMATLNAAEYFRLDGLGAIAPGYRADLVVFDHLSRFQIKKVFKDGRLVAENGKMVRSRFESILLYPSRKEPEELENGNPPNQAPLPRRRSHPEKQPALGEGHSTHPQPDHHEEGDQENSSKEWNRPSDVKEDILKMVVVERHRATGNIGIGFVQGFGLKKGSHRFNRGS